MDPITRMLHIGSVVALYSRIDTGLYAAWGTHTGSLLESQPDGLEEQC